VAPETRLSESVASQVDVSIVRSVLGLGMTNCASAAVYCGILDAGELAYLMSTPSKRIVICGAGIAGVAAAYHLAVENKEESVILVEEGAPLSLTSDKSTEAYRNWWPGPDRAMTAYMNRSIDLMEALARKTNNRFNMNRRGYLFATADKGKIDWLRHIAVETEARGSGPLRMHETPARTYIPSPAHGFDFALTGADLITDVALIHRHFPYLAPDTVAVVHARRAGWLSAQQLGMTLLEAARERGVRLVRGKMTGIDLRGGRVRSVRIEHQGERQTLETTHLVLAAGPMQNEMARMMGVDLPVAAERHLKISFADPLGAIPRAAPMLIWLDAQHLPWSEEERAALAEDSSMRFLLQEFPAGVHGRPDGGGDKVLALFNYDNSPADVVFPLPEEPHYAEITLRGLSRMVPAFGAYVGRSARPYVDGGYYLKTRENRQLIGPLPVEGAYISGAFSGFGVMAACAGGELLAAHVCGRPLPDYAPAFLMSRYQDPAYCALLDDWGDGGQL
jgi:glycine/D-amino acid oxidase-like deaminating enzyme